MPVIVRVDLLSCRFQLTLPCIFAVIALTSCHYLTLLSGPVNSDSIFQCAVTFVRPVVGWHGFSYLSFITVLATYCNSVTSLSIYSSCNFLFPRFNLLILMPHMSSDLVLSADGCDSAWCGIVWKCLWVINQTKFSVIKLIHAMLQRRHILSVTCTITTNGYIYVYNI